MQLPLKFGLLLTTYFNIYKFFNHHFAGLIHYLYYYFFSKANVQKHCKTRDPISTMSFLREEKNNFQG